MGSKITGTALVVALCCFISGALFPAGDIPKQLTIAVLWFGAGAAVRRIWN